MLDWGCPLTRVCVHVSTESNSAGTTVLDEYTRVKEGFALKVCFESSLLASQILPAVIFNIQKILCRWHIGFSYVVF